jgi:hypothetical protein
MNLDIKEELELLLKKEYLVNLGDRYSLSQRYILNKLSNYKVFDEVVYEQINYAQKEEKTANIDTVISQIQKFTTVNDHSRCYIVTYQIEYKDGDSL